MRLAFWRRRPAPPLRNGKEAALEKWAARGRLDEQQRRWPEVWRAVDKFTSDAERALRRHP